VTGDRLRAAIRFGVAALLVVAPLPFGSVEPVWVLVIELTAAVLGLLAIFLLSVDESARQAVPRAPLLICGGVIALGIFQIVPLPFSIAERFNPTAELVRPLIPYLGLDHPPAVSWSVAAPETTDALLRFIAYVLLGLSASVAYDTEPARRRFAVVLVAAAVFQAVYGSAEYLTGRQRIFGFAKKYYLDSATGTFINRNHFATFLAVALPFALTLAIPRHRSRRSHHGWRDRILALADERVLGRAAAAGAAALIWLGLLLSHSRAGLLAALAGAGIVLFHYRSIRAARWAAAVGAVVLVALLTLEVAQAPGERFLDTKGDLAAKGGRLTVWRDSLALVKARPFLGWGFGTFESAFPSVQSADVSEVYDHAHNDWLEWVTEGGALGLLAAVGLVVTSFQFGSVGTRAAIAAFAIHAMTDFSLRIPALAVVAALLSGTRDGSRRGAGNPAFGGLRFDRIRKRIPPA
jgi:O-antigen ligase